MPPHLWQSDIGATSLVAVRYRCHLTCGSQISVTTSLVTLRNRKPASYVTQKMRYVAILIRERSPGIWLPKTSNLLCAYMYQPNVAKTQTKIQATQLGCLQTLQRQNTEISKQIFPEKGISGSQSQFPHSCVCE